MTERRTALVQAATDEMRSYILKDVQILQSVIEDSDTPSGTKVYAVSTMLTQLASWIQITDFEQRLAAIENETKNADFRRF